MADKILVLPRILPFHKQKISQVGFVCLAVVRLEARELDFLVLKPAFKKASTTMIALGFLKNRMFASPQGSVAS